MRRRLTAIVAADIVGYSKRFSEDETGTLAAIQALRTQIIEPHLAIHSGRIFRLIGDSTLLEFESALGAVEFAIQVQQYLAERSETEGMSNPLVLRMGLDLGDVVVEENEIHGEGINIAVRLEKMAEPGGICMSDNIHTQIRKTIDPACFPIGPRSLKNIADPVQVWRWRPKRGAPSPSHTGLSGAGRKPIDARLTELVLKLHARSAQLAISDALDDLLAQNEPTQTRNAGHFYERITEELLKARAMLDGVQVEPIDEFRDLHPGALPYQTLSAFIAGLFQQHGNVYLLRLMPEMELIMNGDGDAVAKRRLCLDLIRRFYDEEFVVRSKGLIKAAFLE